MSKVTYHGPVPQTKSDFKMAKKHLKKTFKLNKEKIKDHEDALEDAQENGEEQSADYNKTHLKGHKKDNVKIKQSMKTVNTLKPAVIRQVKKSPGLTGYVKSKRIGAKAMVQGVI